MVPALHAIYPSLLLDRDVIIHSLQILQLSVLEHNKYLAFAQEMV